MKLFKTLAQNLIFASDHPRLYFMTLNCTIKGLNPNIKMIENRNSQLLLDYNKNGVILIKANILYCPMKLKLG